MTLYYYYSLCFLRFFLLLLFLMIWSWNSRSLLFLLFFVMMMISIIIITIVIIIILLKIQGYGGRSCRHGHGHALSKLDRRRREGTHGEGWWCSIAIGIKAIITGSIIVGIHIPLEQRILLLPITLGNDARLTAVAMTPLWYQ
jgi:hypothetical protein